MGVARVIPFCIELVVLGLLTAAPWAVGGVEPAFEGAIYGGIALLLVLWGIRGWVEGTLRGRVCPITGCLFGLVVLGVVQLVPLPRLIRDVLSPQSGRLLDELLPLEREALDNTTPLPPAVWPAGASLSLYPGATRAEVFRYLAVFLFFVAVRNNVDSGGGLRRLALAMLTNAAFLTLFALVQRFTSPPDILYWTYRAPNQPFGPFINRNHFSFYANLAFGLGLGVLWERRKARGVTGWNPLDLLLDTTSAWLVLGLVLCLIGVGASLSRGGVLSLACAVTLTVAVADARRSLLLRWCIAGLGGAILFVAISALGPSALRVRLAGLWQGDVRFDGRVGLWLDLLGVVRDYPLLGCGYGTTGRVEPLYRSAPASHAWLIEHAHNDYLEALVEGGLLRLGLTLAGIVFVFWKCQKRLQECSDRPERGLLLGAMLGLVAIVLHSFVDFGLHLPAISLLTAAMCAHISCHEREWKTPFFLPGGRITAGCVGAGLLILGGILALEGWCMAEAQSLRLAAYSKSRDGEDQSLEEQVALLRRAVQLTPERAELHLELARVAHPLALAPHGQAEFLPLALHHQVLARDLCPLLTRAQVRLAVDAKRYSRASSPSVYLARARKLYPFDAELHAVAGTMELAEGQRALAMACWRRSLELSETFLSTILNRGQGALSDDDWLASVLPARPSTLAAAGRTLYPHPGDPRRLAYSRAALRAMSDSDKVVTAEDYYLKAGLHEELAEWPEALMAYLAALDLKPRQHDWRLALAQGLVRAGDNTAAKNHLERILREVPEDKAARALWDSLAGPPP